MTYYVKPDSKKNDLPKDVLPRWRNIPDYPTHAARVSDNSEGQDIHYFTLAFEIDGVMYHHANGEPVLQYVGDRIIKKWCLDYNTEPSLTLTGHQLKRALSLTWPDGDADPVQGHTVVTLRQCASFQANEGDGGKLVTLPDGLYLTKDDMPDDGIFPVDGEFEFSAS